MATCISALLALWPAAGRAQSETSGFGKRGSTVVTAENLFGTLDVKLGQKNDGAKQSASQTYDEAWMLAPFAAHVGVFGMGQSGWGGGVLLGFFHVAPSAGSSTTFYDVRPRVAYAMSANALLGAWLRAGPNFFLSAPGEGDSAYAFGLGVEALAVLTPAPHFGILGGLTFDGSIYGRTKDADVSFSIVGLTFGVLVDF